ncbi:hypothetical protein PGTUg99_036560 [Puccinia graminis f. sp. tritici]|uniref:RING-type domain-containing protein n=1 Tax=Puccinia graminis f. sp. tritici TaxID=56615 RepID=A0A5B0RB89_PUCGR|nr:hypothetical protein PGTUg99_036560 [Puccinia graminis f. sp. tritici]
MSNQLFLSIHINCPPEEELDSTSTSSLSEFSFEQAERFGNSQFPRFKMVSISVLVTALTLPLLFHVILATQVIPASKQMTSAGRNVLLKIGPDSTERHVKHEKRGLGMCSVCREEVEEDVWRWPECGHYFHSNCVSRWRTGEVSAGNTCPNCRQNDPECVRGGGRQSSAAPVQAHQVEPEGQPGRLSDWRRQNTRPVINNDCPVCLCSNSVLIGGSRLRCSDRRCGATWNISWSL